ncbi:membrane dipeptidase [Humitalea sp. 24SJ18S-53]|uniref:membrane dipeptidase n=1 Tax=Humitalea sp. 24SJ18S-53 TaxID=3422307 RepID=UPI003D67877C
MTPEARALHAQSVVVDALHTCNWDRSIFEELRTGGYTAVNASNVLWENFRDGIDEVTNWKRRFAENADLIRPVKTVADIHAAKTEGRTGIIMGWQNTSCIEDRLDYLEIFKDLGVGIMQLTYNTQNLSGAGYLEEHDSGLTGFGREVVDEMTRVGVLCDLSHVGDKTSADTIAYSKNPVCMTHVLPRSLRDVKRNKPDELFVECARRGGIIGTSFFSPGLKAGNESTVHDVLDAMEHVITLVGEDHVAVGTDYSQGHARPGPWLLWANKDKGTARTLTEFGSVKINKPAGVDKVYKLPNLTAAMLARGWSPALVTKILGQNWLRLLHQVWGH